ncbi:hypothetical protein GUJ93_ZPchr0003g16501 [Zizania palustris]|uniref:Uncharacterized protein n=1 Tax=Zizania palustris TaxID=103762 RepID=A0A8J5S0N0_ZIZPA|nr:hypothetical protein GUJ93_ZPchr0003g16501 [Zizania palustris]
MMGATDVASRRMGKRAAAVGRGGAVSAAARGSLAMAVLVRGEVEAHEQRHCMTVRWRAGASRGGAGAGGTRRRGAADRPRLRQEEGEGRGERCGGRLKKGGERVCGEKRKGGGCGWQDKKGKTAHLPQS